MSAPISLGFLYRRAGVAPLACADGLIAFLVSGFSLDDGTWKILRCDVFAGVPTWRVVCPHPVPSGDYRPIYAYNLDFSSMAVRYFVFAPGSDLYYSDNEGVTWTLAPGSSGMADFSYPAISIVGLHGFAVTSTTAIVSADQGSNWSPAPGGGTIDGDWLFGVGELDAAAYGHTYYTLFSAVNRHEFRDGTLIGSFPGSLAPGKRRAVERDRVIDPELAVHWQGDTVGTSANIGSEPSGYRIEGVDHLYHQMSDGESAFWAASYLIAVKDSGEGYAMGPWDQLRNTANQWTYWYQNELNHPAAKAAVKVAAFALNFYCAVVGLVDGDAAASQFAIHPSFSPDGLTYHDFTETSQSELPNQVEVPYNDISAAMVAQIGKKYRSSYSGIALVEPGLTKPGRKVPPLICAGFDAATGKQVILGRRNNNEWEVRGPNPYSANDPTLLTHIKRETAHFTGGGSLTYHLLWAYPDWAPGESGKTGLGNNLYYSTDDGATWTVIAAYSDVLDVISTRPIVTTGGGATVANDTLILHDGGTALTWLTKIDLATGVNYPEVGVLGDGKVIALPLVGVANRCGGVQTDERRSGGQVYYHCWTFDETAITASLFRWNDSLGSQSGTSVATATVNYPGAQPLPWEGLRFNSDVAFPGDILFWTGTGEHLYTVRIKAINNFPALPNALVVTGPTILVNTSAAFALALATYLTTSPQQGTNQRATWLAHFKSGRALVYLSLPGTSTQTGLIDGGEAIWGGTPPSVAGITGLDPSNRGGSLADFYTLDNVDSSIIVSTDETGARLATLFLGALPGEGSSPAYTAKRLVELIRHSASATIDYVDESHLLDFGPDHYTVQARTSLSTPLDTSGAHWWNRIP